MTGPRRRFILAFLFSLVPVGCTGETDDRPGPEMVEAAAMEEIPGRVTGMLLASADSWNAGDLGGFLDDYWYSEELTFSGATGITRGWEDVRQRYLDGYWAPGVSRDSLRFEELEVTPLGDAHALVLGRYVLYRPDSAGAVSGTGYFSLVLRMVEGSWKIIHDHTSATPREEG